MKNEKMMSYSEGIYVRGLKEGWGWYMWENKKYEGEFKTNKLHGFGKYTIETKPG